LPFDRFGIKYFYPSKVGGWKWEQDDNPKSQDGVDWPDEMSFPSTGVVRMAPNGPTDFGLGRNIEGFSDSIGGCGMSFKETASRGYAYKANDARDVEMKMLIKSSGIGDSGFSMSACTGHHKSGGKCCQGFAYMLTTELGTNPVEMRFRKEMWHVSYHDCPIDVFKHNSLNFKIDGRSKWTGLGFCRYNDPANLNNNVIVEAWANPDPEADLNNWIMVKRFVDHNGAGWGNDGDDCDGAKDQAGTWSNVQNRFKTNATNGSVDFKFVSLREIDPSADFSTDTGGGSGGGGGGGGGTQVQTVTRNIYCGAISAQTSSGPATGTGALVIYGSVISHEIVESQTDAETTGATGWMDTDGLEIADDMGFFGQYGGGGAAGGLTVDPYWSNSDKSNVAPPVIEDDKGTSTRFTYHGGPVLKTPEVYLIFWGTDWRDRTAAPTMAQVIDLTQNKLLNTYKSYFSKLSQYSGCGIPTWGGAVNNVATPISTDNTVSTSEIYNAINQTFNQGLLPTPDDKAQKIYLLVVPTNKANVLQIVNSNAAGWHVMHKFTITRVVNPLPPSSGGGTGGGTGGGGGTPQVPIRVRGSFTMLRDLNQYRTSACAGSSGGGSSSGSSSKFFFSAPDSDKQLSNSSAWENRTRIANKLVGNHSWKGKVVKQLDVPLKKVGIPVETPISAKIWDSSNNVVYTSPTTFLPSALTTSFADKTFDFSTNTHVAVIGEYMGVEYITTSNSAYVVGGWETDELANGGNINMVQYESNKWDLKVTRDMAMTMWD
jgi:hypothetical protein